MAVDPRPQAQPLAWILGLSPFGARSVRKRLRSLSPSARSFRRANQFGSSRPSGSARRLSLIENTRVNNRTSANEAVGRTTPFDASVRNEVNGTSIRKPHSIRDVSEGTKTLRGPSAVALSAVLLECAIWDIGLESVPIGLEAIARFFERCRYPGTMLARMKAGIEAARPLPLIAIDRRRVRRSGRHESG